MPIVTRPWEFQPPNDTLLDFNNTLTRGIVCGTLGSSPQFIGGVGARPQDSAVPPKQTSAGWVYYGANAGLPQIARSVTTTSDLTLLAITEVPNNNALLSVMAGASHNGASATFCIASADGVTAGKITGRIYLGGYRVIGSSYTAPVGSVVVAIFRHKHNTLQELWVNGKKDTNTGTWTGATVGNQYWGCYSASSNWCGSSLALLWDRYITDEEIAALSDNPWQVFTPRKIWIPSSAGSGSTYTFAVSGGVTFSGAAPQIRSRVAVPSGGVTFSGAASQLRTRLLPSAGGVTFSGSAPIVNDNTYIINPAGGVTFGGTAPELREKVLAPTGGVTFGGSARLTFLPVGGVTTNDMDRISVGVARKIGVS